MLSNAGSAAMLLVGLPVEVLTLRFAAVMAYWLAHAGMADAAFAVFAAGGVLAEHGSKEQLRGLADRGEHGARVIDARHAHDDIFSLKVHLGARDAETVHAVVEDRHDLLHVRLGGGRRGLVDDR